MTPISSVDVVENKVAFVLQPSADEEEKPTPSPRVLPDPLSLVAVNDKEAGQNGVGGVSWEDIFFRRVSETESLREAIGNNWSRLAISKLSQQAFSRLEDLAAETDGWNGPNSKALSPMSLRHFLRLWNEIRDEVLEPEFALASNGHLCAEWHSSWKKHLDLEFADDGRVFFGLFDGKSILEGVEKGAELSRMLLARKGQPLKWKS